MSNSVLAAGTRGEYVWTFPGSPVRIQIGLAVVPRIREYLFDDLDDELAEPTEKGGLLLGIIRPRGAEIIGFEPFSPTRKGPYFVLSETDKARLAELIEVHQTRHDPVTVVGYFRSDFRDGIRLYQEDLLLIEQHFKDLAQVFLVIRRQENGAPLAGFFFWDRGFVFADATFMEFPLDDEWLAMPRNHIRTLELSTADSVDDRKDLTLNAPHAIRPSSSLHEWKKVVRATSKRPLVWATLPVLAIACIWGLYRSQRLAPSSQPTPATSITVLPATSSGTEIGRTQSAPISPMSLSAAQADNSIAITWDPKARIIEDARIGVLSIKDGSAEKDIPLTSAQLHGGKIFYAPQTTRLHMTLEVFSQTGKTTRDSATVIVTRSTPANFGPGIDAGDVESPAPERPISEARTFSVVPSQAQKDALKPHVLTEAPAIQFAAADPGKLRTPDFPLAQPPAPSANTQPTPSQVQQSGATPIAPGPPSHTEPVTSTPVTPILPPKAIRQSKPVLPPTVKAMLKRRVDIQIRVNIDASGKVVRAEPVASQTGLNPYLSTTAANAARLWIFQPARRGDAPVPSEMILQFSFGPENNE